MGVRNAQRHLIDNAVALHNHQKGIDIIIELHDLALGCYMVPAGNKKGRLVINLGAFFASDRGAIQNFRN